MSDVQSNVVFEPGAGDNPNPTTPPPAPPTTPGVKPGYQTTEFWVHLLSVIVAAIIGSGLFTESSAVTQILAIAATLLSALGYSASRTSLKLRA